jgi:hypothetical protein
LFIDPIEPGLEQDGVMVDYVVAGDIGEYSVATGAWTIQVYDHALGRLAERNPGVDLTAATLRAHDYCRGAAMREIYRYIMSKERFLVPIDGGAFVCHTLAGTDPETDLKGLHVMARTYLHDGLCRRPHGRHRDGRQDPIIAIAIRLGPAAC